MGYLFSSFALLSGAIKGFCGKKLGNLTKTLQSAVFFNTVRMLICICFGFVLVLFSGELKFISFAPDLILISILSGFSTSLFVISWLMIIQKSAYMLVDVFLTLGTIVPMCFCRFLFSETISPRQWIGYFILLAASLIMCSYNNSINMKLTISGIILLIFCGMANGFADLSQKIFVKNCPQTPTSVFNLYTYVVAAIVLGAFLIISCLRKGRMPDVPKENTKKGLHFIVIMAIALFLNSYFKTQAATYLDSAKLYPFNQGASLIISTLMSAIFFKEKITLKCILGIILAFVALMTINL